MKKRLLSYICAALTLAVLTACGGSSSPESSSAVTETTTVPPETTTVTELTTAAESLPPPAINLLTGQSGLAAEAVNKRPIAVMINNNTASLPQYGTEAADVIMELPVEGGITRLMALYSDYTKMPNVCSIRSCRYYFPLLAYGMDAIYIHWGSDQSIALETLNRLQISHLDGGVVGGPLFGRDAVRRKTYALEHTGYLDGSQLPSALANGGYRTDLKDGYNKTLFTFNAENAPQAPQGIAANQTVLQFSKAYYSTFTYDAATATYLKQHNGAPHMDSSTGNQLRFTNVIVLQTNIGLRGTGGLLNVDLTSGTGKYISNGAAEDITWSKAGDEAPVVLTKADGTPLSVNTGKSYVAFIGYDKAVTVQ